MEKKERSIKELLQVMLDNQQFFDAGLCLWALHLQTRIIITWEETQKVLSYIKANRPSKWSSRAAFKYRNSEYFWTIGDIEPRLKWLEKHIKLNS